MIDHRMALRLNLQSALAALALAGAAGCGADDDPSVRAQVGNELDAAIDGGSGTLDAGVGLDAGPSPDAGGPGDAGTGPRIVEVTAIGTGCPSGSAVATIAPDGQSVSVALSKFVLEVSPASALAVMDCQLAVRVTTEAGKQYQLGRTVGRGSLQLDPGVSARVQIARYFQGNPEGGEEVRNDLVGPRDEELTLGGDSTSALWSPCGAPRELNVRFTGRLVSGADTSRGGSLALDEAQVFALSTRSCRN